MRTRILSFPKATPLGYLHTRHGAYPYTFHGRFKEEGGMLENINNPGWEILGDANGDICTGAECVLLEVLADPAKDLSFLSHLEASDLDAIWLGNTLVHDDQLHHLRHLTGLRWIDLQNNMSITAKGIAQLAGLTSLRHLGLHWTNLTDAALNHFQEMRKLEYLDVWGCPITGGAIDEFKSQHPGCEVRT